MNPGVARLAIVVVLVVGGVAVLANGFSDQVTAADPSPSSPSVSPSESPSPTSTPGPTTSPNQEGVLVQVLNGTAAAGLAGDF